jgi:excisionase family DNA binding protein
VEKEWYSPEDVADLYGVSISTVYRWTSEGRLPAYKVGGVRRYKRDDVDALAEPIEPQEEAQDDRL